MTRYFMTIPEAAGLVIQAGAIGNGGEILVLDMGEPVRIVDLAADMIRLSGLRVGEDIEIQFTGVRPGEKLYEELHIAGEKDLPTRHPKITVADRKRRDPAAVLAAIERLAGRRRRELRDGDRTPRADRAHLPPPARARRAPCRRVAPSALTWGGSSKPRLRWSVILVEAGDLPSDRLASRTSLP